MTAAGIDYSSNNIDIVLLNLDNDHAAHTRYSLAGGDILDRARCIRDQLPTRSHWQNSGVIAIGIERPAGRYAVDKLSLILGGILQTLPRELLVSWYRPAEWRHLVGLSGNASKAEVRDYAITLGAPLDASYDQCDALCIAHAVRSQIQVSEAA